MTARPRAPAPPHVLVEQAAVGAIPQEWNARIIPEGERRVAVRVRLGTTASILPFGLARQSEISTHPPLQLGDECLTVIPGNAFHWIVQSLAGLIETRRIAPHPLLPLRLGDLCLAHVEIVVESDQVLRELNAAPVIVRLVPATRKVSFRPPVPHQERPGGDAHQAK